MANFPTSLPSITNPTANDTLAAVPHHTQHSTANDEIAAIAAKMGTGSSTPAAATLLVGTGTGTSAWQNSIGTGDEQHAFVATTGTVIDIRRGTTAAPDTSNNPAVKVTRVIDLTGVTGDGFEEAAAIYGIATLITGGTVQPIGVAGVAVTNGLHDATGGYFVGSARTTSVSRRGIGFFAGGETRVASGAADGGQIAVGNHGNGGAHTVHPTGIATTTGLWICAASDQGYTCGVGVQIGNGFGEQFDVAFHVNGQTTESPKGTITSASVANPTVVTWTQTSGSPLVDGDEILITGSDSTPSIDGTYAITRLSATTFSIPVNVTVAGSTGTFTARIGAAKTAAYRDDSSAKNSYQAKGSHSTAVLNLSEATGLSVWLPRYVAATNTGVIAATNMAGNGTTRLAYYTSAGVLNLGAESSINSGAFHTFTAGGAGIGKTTTSGLRAVNNAGNGYVRMLDYDGALLTLGAGSEASGSPGIYSAKYHSFGAGIYVGAVDITTDTTTGTKIGTSTSQKLGFYGATPIAKPSGVAVSAAGIHAALVSLGLIAA